MTIFETGEYRSSQRIVVGIYCMLSGAGPGILIGGREITKPFSKKKRSTVFNALYMHAV